MSIATIASHPNGTPGCQDHCPDGLADKAKYNEMKAADAKARGRSNGTAYAQRVDSMTRACKKRKGKKF